MEGCFTTSLLKRVVYQVSEGLNYMKAKSVIHCDLKPENILFTDDRYKNIKLIDFGSSCQDYTKGFSYVMSRYYRAPEVVFGNRYGHGVDMWSLGCIIYELLTGRVLFPAKDENALVEWFVVTLGSIPE